MSLNLKNCHPTDLVRGKRDGCTERLLIGLIVD